MLAPAMSATLGALLEEQAGAIAGRERERALLATLLEDGGPVAAHVHGLAGVGKTALLRAFAADARAAGAAVVEVDGHAIYPTQGELLAAVAGTGRDAPPALEDAVAALGARGERVVLLLDAYELMRVLDPWICRTFLPALGAHVRVVMAGRDAPHDRWRAYGPLLRGIVLGNLPPHDALALLRRDGLDEAAAHGVNSVAHGHPLSLQLATWALRDRPGLSLDEVAARTVGGELARLYLDGLDADTRRALDAAALTRRTTLSLLEAMLPDQRAEAAFERLRRLPFVELAADGLVVHDTVREATAALLRARHPGEYWRMRAAAWGRLRSELRGAPRHELRRYTADMIYLIEHQAVRKAFFPPAAGELCVGPAEPRDLPAIEALVDDPELLRAWWEAVPEAFVVARNANGAARGFACLADPQAVGTRLLDRDPLASGWRAHLRGAPLPGGQEALFLRWITGTPLAGAALILDVTRTYVERRPALRRVYARAADFEDVDASCALVMGYLPLEGQPGSACVDFGPASVDGWLTELGERELLAEPGAALPDNLTRLEAELLGYLRRREGEVVERAALLRDVWGYDWTGGSNVVEVVVSALRRKLGDRASALETVRGVGYRLRPLG